ncbi:MAG: hypothetical protein QXU45_06155 [Candidatus Bathyarchaeia archaeon]
MTGYKVIWKPYRATHLTAHEPLEFEEEINKLTKEGWIIKSSNVIYVKVQASDWIMFYALLEKTK